MHMILGGQVGHPLEFLKALQVLKLGFDKVDYFGSANVFDLLLGV